MKSSDFVARLTEAAKYKTVYVQGAFGAPMVTEPWNNVARYTDNSTNAYNKKHADEIKAVADKGYFGFDCVCLLKGILWGWCGDANARYGGAEYKSNGVPDLGTEEMFAKCTDQSADFDKITVGEILWKQGHIGVYVGDGLAVECTPAYKGGVQVTAVKNIGKKAGYSASTWTKHGYLPYVEYDKGEEVKRVDVKVAVIKKGVKCDAVRAVQALLNMRIGAGLDIDGSCGGKTDAAIREFQRSAGLSVDGSCGRATWTALLGE